jgi:hypothetical protein
MNEIHNLKENFKFYDLNRNDINKGHIGDYAFIQDSAVKAYFKDEESAYASVLMSNAKPGSFILHQCLPEEEDFDDIGCHIPVPAFEVDWK